MKSSVARNRAWAAKKQWATVPTLSFQSGAEEERKSEKDIFSVPNQQTQKLPEGSRHVIGSLLQREEGEDKE